MSVHPFPEPDPSLPDIFTSLFGILNPFNLVENAIDIVGDLTVGDVYEQAKDMPLKDILKEFLK